MIIVYSKNSIPIRITQERWEHIARRHPELEAQKEKVEETIQNPDLIQKGDFGELLAVKLFVNTPLKQKHLVVAYKEFVTEQDGFILTAYFTNMPSQRRKIIWTR